MSDLIPMAIMFFAGFACRWLLDLWAMRKVHAAMAEQQKTIATLRQQATHDVERMCDLEEQLSEAKQFSN